MKSLMRIYIRSLITCFLLFAAFILVQMGIAAVVAGRIYNREVPGRYFIQNIYEALGTGGEEALLDEMGASFAMLLDDEGNLVWSKDLPGELAHSYTSSQIASFSRWYLEDYPVSVWGGEKGLLVVGHPKGSVWNYSIHQNMRELKGLLTFLCLGAAATFLGILLLFFISGFRYYRRMRILGEGIEMLAAGEPVCLPETGQIRETAKALNTASRRLMSQRQALDKRDEARTQWIQGVSHDIRTPLSLIMGYADMLQTQMGKEEPAGRMAAMIRQQSLRIRNLVEDLNIVSRLEYGRQPLRLAEVSPAALLRQVLADILNTVENEAAYPIAIEISPAFGRVRTAGDENLLFRAFYNILSNSIRHNEEGCRLTVQAYMEGDTPVICFSDDGAGIPEAICRYLNEGISPGEDVHLMGLRIVRQIIISHGWTIRAENAGLCIRIQLSSVRTEQGSENVP